MANHMTKNNSTTSVPVNSNCCEDPAGLPQAAPKKPTHSDLATHDSANPAKAFTMMTSYRRFNQSHEPFSYLEHPFLL